MYSGARIKQILEHQGRRQEWLAERTGRSKFDVSRFLSGARRMPDEFAERSAELLDVPLELLAETQEPSEVA